MPDKKDVASRLESVGQEHLLHFHDELDTAGQRRLLERIDGLEIERLPELIERYVKDEPTFVPPAGLAPAPYYPRDPESPKRSWDIDEYRLTGEEAIRAGRIALFTVAGGQGTRLGYDGPKGCYPAAAVTRKPLFRCLAEWLLAAQKRYNVTIPWYLMTSELNHEPTISFFKDQNWFGLDPEHVMHFQQGVMPSLDKETGKVLLAEKDRPAVNPDGHGGSLKALYLSGAIEDMKRRGVDHISYVQVDNPIVRAIDPVFIGLHIAAPDSSGEMSSKMIEKTEPSEKVGVFCKVGDRIQVIEYSDLPDELAQQRADDGSLRFNAGSPAIHMIGVDFVERLNESEDEAFSLPLHRAVKKVPHVDLDSGEHVEPDEQNAVKLEMFVFDAIPLCESSIILQTDRIEEFAPIKNAEGSDSPATSRRVQTERAARWLESAGAKVARTESGDPDCMLEISPLTAMGAEDLKRDENKNKIPQSVAPGTELAI